MDLKESAPYDRVILHPLVLLSAVDHFNRIGNVSRNSRVIGCLLGATKIIDGKRVLDISNSFAVPFDEDSKDASVWYLDHDYLDTMFNMYRKVNAKERVVGWYHTGPELRANDTEINEIFKKYTKNSILTIIETTTNDWSLPTRSYYCTEEVYDDGTPSTKTFNHLPNEIGAEEAEEVGVEHLLRDVHNNTQGSLSQKISNQIKGLKGFAKKLAQIAVYLEDIANGKLPMNYKIIYGLQDIFNYLPDVSNDKFNNALQHVTNDQMLIVYLSSMIKSVIALHNLIDNKLDTRNKEQQEEDQKENERKKKMEGAAEQKKKELEEKENKDGKKSTGNDDMKDGEEEQNSKSRRMTRSRSKNSNPDSAKKNRVCDRALFNEEFEDMSLKLQQQLFKLCEKMQLSMDNSRVC